MARALGAAYLARVEEAQAFYPHDFRGPGDRAAVARHAATLGCAPGALAALGHQQARWGLTPAAQAHLDALATGEAAVVATGQQVGLFLGPLYTFYKAATAIAVARDLEAATGRRVVPLFWLQTEDHDLPEIASTYLPQREAPLALSYEAPSTHRSAVAHHRFGPELPALCAQLQAALDGLPHAAESMALWASYQVPGTSPHEAFARSLAALFGDHGLLLFQPRDPAVAPLAAQLHREALEDADAVRQALVAREEAIAAAGFRVQIPTRPESCLSFFHPEGPEGPRYRVMQRGDGYGLAGHDGRFTRAQLMASLDEAPMCWSTSALLRPLLQDSLFPTAAYVGGPGEFAYFGQLQPLYEWQQRPMPLLVPRARFQLIEAPVQKLLDALSLSPADLNADEATLLGQLSLEDAPGPSPEALEARLVAPFSAALDAMADEITQLDPNLSKAIDKTRHHVASGVEKLAHKIQHIRLQRDQQRAERLVMAQSRLYPLGKPQERVFGLPYFIARYGVEMCKDAIFEALAVYETDVAQIALPPPDPREVP